MRTSTWAPFGTSGDFTLADALSLSDNRFRNLVSESRVIVIRSDGSAIDPVSFVALMRKSGRFVLHPVRTFASTGFDFVTTVSNLYIDGIPYGFHEGGCYWHSDMSYRSSPTTFTGLYAARNPKEAGSSCTEFIDCYAATAGLLARWREGGFVHASPMLDPYALTVEHRFGNRAALLSAGEPEQHLSTSQRDSLERNVTHPLIAQHPLSGLSMAYALAGTSMRVVGFSEATSFLLLEELLTYVLDHAPMYVHEYRVGDIVIWDNMSTLHRGRRISRSYDVADCRLLYRVNTDYAACVMA